MDDGFLARRNAPKMKTTRVAAHPRHPLVLDTRGWRGLAKGGTVSYYPIEVVDESGLVSTIILKIMQLLLVMERILWILWSLHTIIVVDEKSPRLCSGAY